LNPNPFRRIWRADPIRIPLPAGFGASLAPFRGAVSRFGLLSLGSDSCVGSVTDTRVRLRHKRAFWHNDMAPVLDAVMTTDVHGRCLSGVYRSSWHTRILLTIWFGFLLLLLPFFILAGLTQAVPGSAFLNLVFAGAPLAMLLIGSGMLIWAQRCWDEDKRFLEAFVTAHLARSHTAV
jgi:hypothetical protein